MSSTLPASTSASATGPVSPAALWALVVEPSVVARFSAELQAARYAEGSAPGLGATIEGTNQRGDVTWESVATVTAFEPPVLFEWTVGEPADPVAIWRFELEEGPSGTTLTQRATLHPGPSPVTAAVQRRPERAEQIIEGRLAEFRQNMEATVVGIVELAGG